MRLVDYIQSSELEPNLPDGTVVDREEIGRLLAGEAATRSETELARALTDQLYTLVGLSNGVSIAFTSPSRVFLVETARNSDVEFELEKALEYIVPEDRPSLRNEYETRLHMIGKGKGDKLA